MAEFCEVMRQWRRMCGANNSCGACRIVKENLPYTLCSEGGIRSVENIADVELTIMSWAAEHPEPVYPSWLEYLMDTQPDCREAYKVGNDLLWRWMWEAPIPADIAEKLGIEPKEG